MKSQQYLKHIENQWLALEIGNSRLHWALFVGESLKSTCDTEYLPESVIQQLGNSQTNWGVGSGKKGIFSTFLPLPPASYPLPLFIASVVPKQTALWESYPDVRVMTLDQIPLKNIYPTLGIDRALALWGAGMTWGFPMLVIDGGTALTFTAADAEQTLVGGAILPGVGLQFVSLGQKTGQLPQVKMEEITSLPPRFALNTAEAMQSGVIYTLLAGIKDFIEAWLCLFPDGKIAIKGGDRILLLNYLQTLYPEMASSLIVEPNLIFWGMQKIVMATK
ncbi:pantothenate kinase [Anabaena subtropica]|uniref:Type III pantothenate kinase n=1 Tax=Anabaena subtropica FACHB-260 TaxID=2692884 RepID=A0ABR8CWF7_9NOST|nr:pantothenate kinase [Anabaena subtropica]MBD2346140.1 pantothenate kinase [Anabaena subtropica FACHB-260]